MASYLCFTSLVIFCLFNASFVTTMTVDFDQFPLRYGHLNWLLQDARFVNGENVTGFNYESGSGPGERPNQHGVTWPNQSYYDMVLGAGGFDHVRTWSMKAIVLYAQEKPGSWATDGWNPSQDLAEGAAYVGDAARTAVALATDYLLNGEAASLAAAKALLTFTCYLTTTEGKVYGFAWLDAPKIFGWDEMQRQNKHYAYRSEFYRRRKYPDSHSDWMEFLSDPANIIKDENDQYVRAEPFLEHPPYSIMMNDLKNTTGANIALVYDGPLYNSATGKPSSYLKNITRDWTTSTQELTDNNARQLWALAVGLQMMQKVKVSSPGQVFSADDSAFAAFLENHANRVMNNILKYEIGEFDNRLASFFLIGMVEYFRIMYVGGEYGKYTPIAIETNAYDKRPNESDIYVMMDKAINKITSCQFRSSDWRDGIFVDNANTGDWQAWGQLQIYALSTAYRLKRDLGQPASALSGMLDIITHSADNFYGIQAYHYTDQVNNCSRTRERITNIVSSWEAIFDGDQIAFHQSSIVAGLIELAEAYGISGRVDASTRKKQYLQYAKIVASWFIGNNAALQPMYAGNSGPAPNDGSGAFFDAISIKGPCSHTNEKAPCRGYDAGAETTAEGLWAMVLIKNAIQKYSLGSKFTFNE